MSAGEIDVGSSGSVGGLNEGGAFTVSGGTLNINSGGTLTMAGTLDRLGGAFNLASGGVISGGAFDATGGAIGWNGGTLSGVKVWGPLNMTGIGATLHLANGASVVGASGSGAGIINATGSGANLYLDDAQTVANETINIGYSTNGLNYIQLVAANASYGLAASTTLNVVGRSELNYKAAGITEVNSGAINVSGGVFQITGFGLWNYDDYLTNAGSITINSGGSFLTELSNFTNSGAITVNTGGTATIDPTTFTTTSTSAISIGASATLTLNVHNSWSNLGSISLASGATLLLEDDAITSASLGTVVNGGGAVEIGPNAVYSNTGATLNGTAGPGVLTLYGGAISGGTATSAGLAFSTKGGALNGVTVDGSLTLGAGQVLALGTGTQFLGANGTGAGVLNVTGAAAYLNLSTDTTIANETINLGSSAGSPAYIELNVASSAYSLAANATLNVVGSADLDFDKVSNSFTNNGAINETAGALNLLGYATSGFNDVFTNAGAFTLGSGTSLYTLNLTTFVNSGALTAAGNNQLTIGATNFTDSGSISTGNSTTLIVDPTNFTVGAAGSITLGTGSYAYIEPSNAWTNFASGALTGGSYAVGANSEFEAYSASTFTTLAANVTLSGAGSQFVAYNSSNNVTTGIDASLTSIAASGSFSLLGGRNWTIGALPSPTAASSRSAAEPSQQQRRAPRSPTLRARSS